MHVYHVSADKYGYDQYDSFTVWADTVDQAEQIVTDFVYEHEASTDQNWTAHVVPVPEGPEIIMGSFNAG